MIEIDVKTTEMRGVLAALIDDRMSYDERVMVIDADLSASMSTAKLREKYPERALNVGIAEQNMASIAGGLSSYGFIPFIYSFAPFVTRRIADQIMISMAYAHQNVRIVGTDPGIVAELNGGTHMSFEDIATLRSIPNVVIFEPADAATLAGCFNQLMDYKGVVYIRLFRKVAPLVHKEGYKANLFKADVLKEGSDVTIVASGIMVNESLRAAELLAREGISAEVIDMHTVKPLDADTLLASINKTGAVVTAENHNVIGALRSAVSECLAENCPVPLEAVGVYEQLGEVGKLPYLKTAYGMTADNIVDKAKKVIARKQK